MSEQLIWSIGSPDGRSNQLVDNYKETKVLDEVVFHANNTKINEEQKWPLFHPSEADPDSGYKLHPYTIKFMLDNPKGDYVFRMNYLIIAPRLAHLELNVNGVIGFGFLKPKPSESGEIKLHAGLHTSIYSEGVLEVIIPREILVKGENTIQLLSKDGGEYIHVDNIEKIKRLDRMANGAGFIYQYLTFSKLADNRNGSIQSIDILPTVLYKRNGDGKLSEKCHLYLELSGPVDVTTLTLKLQFEDKEEQLNFQLPETKFGHFFYDFYLPDGKGKVNYEISWLEQGIRHILKGQITRRRKWKVYITPHSHTDIGYTHRQWEVAERLCRNIDTAITLIENGVNEKVDIPVFAYHLDASWVLEAYMATRNKKQIKKLFNYVKEGLIGIPHSYCDLLTQYASLEDLIRNGEYTESILEPIGMRSNYTAVVDVPSLTGSIPAIYEGSGVKYLVHANNQDRGPFRLNGGLHKLSPFYWEGTNGGRVLVWLSKMYCELRKVCGSPPVISSAERGLGMWLDEFETDTYAPDAVLLYGQEADNTDIDPQPIDFTKEWNETYAYPKLIASNVSSFFEYVEENFGETLQTVKGDSGAYWEDGAGSSIVPTMDIRHTQAMLPAAEKLESLAVIHNDSFEYPKGNYDSAWKSTLQYVEHTWGAFLSATDPDALLQEDQWSVKEHFAKDGLQWGKRLLHSAAVRHSLNWNNDGREVVVYNPHSWTVSSPIIVEIGTNEKVISNQNGEEIPTRVIQSTKSQMVVELWIDSLPGLSYRRIQLKETENSQINQTDNVNKQNDTSITIENRYYQLVIDLEHGMIHSLYDMELEKELVNQSDEYGFGQFLYAKGGEGTRLVGNQSDLADGNPNVLTNFELLDYTVNKFSYGTSVTVKGMVPYGELVAQWTLLDTVKKIDVQFDYKKEERLEKEAVYISFPMNIQNAEAFSDSQIGWVNWDKDQLPGGCKEWLPLQTSILVNGENADMLIASPDIPLFTVGNVVQGRWPKELDLSGSRIFSYVLNNYWNTNYKASQGGNIRFQYAITSASNITKDKAYRFGWEMRQPLYGHRISFQDFRNNVKEPYNHSSEGTLAKIESNSVVLSTMKKANAANSWILRLQEIAGTEEMASISIQDKKIQKGWITDLLEKDLEEILPEADGTLNIKVNAWGLKTIRIILD